MHRYSKKLILNYINGEELPGYDIDKLESDYRFMMEVIKLSHDKKIYNLCNCDIKNNYEFVKFLIQEFRNDKEFIEKVADQYFKERNTKDVAYRELLVIISNILREDKNLENAKYLLLNQSFYDSDMLNIFLCKSSLDRTQQQEMGLGFVYIEDIYDNSEIILDYYASKLIEEIFYKKVKYSFEEIIHINIKDPSTLTKIGPHNFLLEYISVYDNALSYYISVHTYLLNEVIKNLHSVINRWNFYIDNLDKKRNILICEKIDKFIEQYNDAIFTFNIYGDILEIFKSLNIKSKYLKNYYDYNIVDDFSECGAVNLIECEFKREMRKFIKTLYKVDCIKNIDIYSPDEEEKNGKILYYKKNDAL